VSDETAATYVDHLRRDLDGGVWDRKYEFLRSQPTFDGSLRLIVSRPPGFFQGKIGPEVVQ
jgi:hypothetical protein